MDSSPKRSSVKLPFISEVKLYNFDLYTLQPNTETIVEKGVFCLIGANGLGKSTFLNTVNYAITGSIPDSSRKFISSLQYFETQQKTTTTQEYFNGRISELSRSFSQVSVKLSWTNFSITITRDIFNNQDIKEVVVLDSQLGKETRYPSDEELLSAKEISQIYESKIIELTGLKDFSQFVFLFHFICTFDEGRHLLMWDRAALTNALYLAFGGDPSTANKADKLQADMEKWSSRARNSAYSARQLVPKIKELRDLISGNMTDDFEDLATLESRHDSLIQAHSEAVENVNNKLIELRDADLKWTDLSASLTERQMEYRKVFSERAGNISTIRQHPAIQMSLAEDQCTICGTTDISGQIQSAIESGSCPLCDGKIETHTSNEKYLDELKEIDKQISSIREKLGIIKITKERIDSELTLAEARERQAYSELNNFEKSESKMLTRIEAGNELKPIKEEIERLENTRSSFLEESKEHYKKRDHLRNELRIYERDFKSQYEMASQEFVPRFRELAEEFIGIPIDVTLEHRKGKNDSGFSLNLSMNDLLRTKSDKLSESQRFFIDIALRMTLVEFISNDSSTLLVDTPEGSLDIAYEARAGAMFSKFVSENQRLLLTANLRSSHLVLRLAEIQGNEGMQIVRMTDWTELSTVQKGEEKLFYRAYEDIESALSDRSSQL